jgi:phage terminase Nu1 subunit (DNA packaging protein)
MKKVWISQKEIAAGLSVSEAMVSKLKKAGMPVTSIKAAQEWRRLKLDRSRTIDYRRTRHPRHQAARAAARTGPDARERLDAVRAEIAELDLAERRGELIQRSTALAGWQKQVSAFRSRSLAIVSRVSAQFPADMRVRLAEVLEREIYEALAELGGADRD